MIEISDSKYWKKLTEDEAKNIITFIVIEDKTDWRLPTYKEIVQSGPLLHDNIEVYVNSMWVADSNYSNYYARHLKYLMVPVRDL
jgi:hypothetical protein